MSGMDELIAALRVEPSAEDVASGQRIAQALQTRIAAAAGAPSMVAAPRRVYLWGGYLVAAVSIAIVGIKYLPTINRPGSITQTYTTAPAQRASVTLADGSIITLAPATIAHVTGRTIDLSGEAVFTVTQHNGSPFTVKTGKTVTRVLGTRFGVRAYSDEASVRVAVEEGRVSVASSTLSAGEIITIRGNTSTITREEDVANLFSWTTGRLAFRGDSLGAVIRELSRWYNADIRLSSQSMVAIPVTTVITTEPVSVILPAVAEAAGLTVTRSGNAYIIKGN